VHSGGQRSGDSKGGGFELHFFGEKLPKG